MELSTTPRCGVSCRGAATGLYWVSKATTYTLQVWQLTRCVRQTSTVRRECWGEDERGRLGLDQETRFTAVHRNQIEASNVRRFDAPPIACPATIQ